MWVKILTDDVKVDHKKVEKGDVVNIHAALANSLIEQEAAEATDPPKGKKAVEPIAAELPARAKK
jgi:hypothetical protein